MWPDSPYAHGTPSFPLPVTPPTVDADSAPVCAVFINAAWFPVIRGALKQLLLEATWDTSDTSVLNLAQQRVFDLINLFDDECNMFAVRQDPDNPCLLDFSTDGGTTWTEFADLSGCVTAGIGTAISDGTLMSKGGDPRTDGTPAAPWPSGSVPPGQTAQCLTGGNISSELKSFIDDMVAGISAGNGVLNIAAGLISLLAIALDPALAIVAAIESMVSGAVGFGSAAITAAFTSTVYHDFACIVQCHAAADGSIDAAAFSAIETDCDAHFTGVAQTLIHKFLDVNGPNGLTLMANKQGVSSYDCSDCGCGKCAVFDFSIGELGWQSDPEFTGGTATYDGTKWVFVNDGTNSQLILMKAIPTGMELTHVQVEGGSGAAGGSYNGVYVNTTNGIGSSTKFGSFVVPALNPFDIGCNGDTVGQSWMWVQCGVAGNTSAGNFINKIKLYYNGPDPADGTPC